MLLDAALQAATGLQQLLAFRHDCTTVTTPAEQAAAAAGLTSAAAELGTAAEALYGAHRAGRDDRTVRPYRGTRNDGPVSTATASSFLNAAGTMGG